MHKIIKGSALAGFIAAIAVMGMVAANMEREPTHSYVSVRSMDLDDHLEASNHIIIGLVKEVNPDQSMRPDIPRYFGDVIVVVEEDLLGTVDGDEITIRTQPNIRESPSFVEGERTLLFLIPSHPKSVEGEGVYVVSGVYQGKYDLDEANDKLVDPFNDERTYRLSEVRDKIANRTQQGTDANQ